MEGEAGYPHKPELPPLLVGREFKGDGWEKG